MCVFDSVESNYLAQYCLHSQASAFQDFRQGYFPSPAYRWQGLNRRPSACKATTELWPLPQGKMKRAPRLFMQEECLEKSCRIVAGAQETPQLKWDKLFTPNQKTFPKPFPKFRRLSGAASNAE